MSIHARLKALERRYRPKARTFYHWYYEDAETGEMVFNVEQSTPGEPGPHDDVINIHFVFPEGELGDRVKMAAREAGDE